MIRNPRVIGDVCILDNASEYELQFLAENMRESDKLEVLRASGAAPLEALERAMRYGGMVKVAYVRAEPTVIGGIIPRGVLTGGGVVWLLATDNVRFAKKSFVKAGRILLSELQGDYQVLYNYVDAQNNAAIAYLLSMGFTIDAEPRPFGIAGNPFYRFERKRDSV